MFTIDYQSREPIYEQLYNNVVRMIGMGIISPNERLPTVRMLAQQLGINPNTVSKSYQLLEQNGDIYSIAGKGSFAADSTIIINSKRESIKKEIMKSVKSAADLGISKEDIYNLVNTVYFGGDGEQ